VNDNDAIINIGAWIPNLHLDPLGHRMKKNEHHSVMNAGFDYMVSIIQHLHNKYEGRADKLLEFGGYGIWDERRVAKVTLYSPNFHFDQYTVQASENLIDIARKFHVCEHMILANNEEVDDYRDVSAGQTIRVPSDYAKRTVLYLSREHWLPIKMVIYDGEGLYERFDYLTLSINPDFPAGVFSPDYEKYGF
jgi:hypothetical protein